MQVDSGVADFEFFLQASPTDRTSREWIHCWHSDVGSLALSLGSTGDGFLLRFPGLADFDLSEEGRRIGAWPEPETNVETLRHLLLDQVLPRLLAHRGRVVLHAGAVRVDGRVIGFLGQTGFGKSTLAASFHEAGFRLLSDDGLVLTPAEGRILALPTYCSLRLWPDAVAGLFASAPALAPMAHYSSKHRVPVGEAAESASVALPLAALYVLAPESGSDAEPVSLTRLSPRDACVEVIRNSFQLDVTDRRRAAGLLEAASSIARYVPAFRLAFPRDFSCLPDVRAAILKQRDQWESGVMNTAQAGRPDEQADRL